MQGEWGPSWQWQTPTPTCHCQPGGFMHGHRPLVPCHFTLPAVSGPHSLERTPQAAPVQREKQDCLHTDSCWQICRRMTAVLRQVLSKPPKLAYSLLEAGLVLSVGRCQASIGGTVKSISCLSPPQCIRKMECLGSTYSDQKWPRPYREWLVAAACPPGRA